MKDLFNWKNIKFLIVELINIFSNNKSFFSKKRIESGIAFAVAQSGMITYMIMHVNNMTTSDIAMWAGVEFAVAGYVLNQIQKEKKSDTANTVETNNENKEQSLNS